MSVIQNAGSFRDRYGHVFHYDGEILRTVLAPAKAQYEQIKATGLIDASIEKGFLIGTEELSKEDIADDLSQAAYVLRHQKIPFISHPYEWSFYQLKAAALHHLKFEAFLLSKGAKLRDASAYNIQFVGARPVFIDLLSIAPYADGEPWMGHRQFCEQFLNPLLLRSLKGITHFGWYRGNLEGIGVSDLAKLLSFKDKLNWKVLIHVVMQARLDNSARRNPSQAIAKARASKGLPKSAYAGFLSQLRSWIEKLEPKDQQKTVWGDYATNNTYLDDEATTKRRLIVDFTAKSKPCQLIDLGCNSGDYSVAALEGGAQSVIGFDFDAQAIDLAFRRAQCETLPFLPLYLDATNPSPDQGWFQQERRGFLHRAKVDSVIALAFIHHLVIGKNIPLQQAVHFITGMAPNGLIEFVPKNDETVRQMLALREDIFDDYTEDCFVRALSTVATIVDSHRVSASGRRVFEFSRHPPP